MISFLRGIFKIIWILMLILIPISCKKEKNLFWQSTNSIPLIDAIFTLSDIINDTVYDSSKSPVKLIYQRNLFDMSRDNKLLVVPDTTLSNEYYLPMGSISVVPSQLIFQSEQEFQLNTGTAKLNKIILKEGILNIKIKSRILQPIKINYELPSAKKNNVNLEINAIVNGATDIVTPSIFETNISLSGYSIDLTGKQQNSLNKIVSKISIFLSELANQTNINSQNKVEIIATLKNITPSFARGNFGQSTIYSQSNIDLSAFKVIKSGNLYLSKVESTIEVENGVGVDARIQLEKLESINNSSKISLISNELNTPFYINRAVDNPYNCAIKSIQLNEQNSNIKQFIENFPERISCDYKIDINPLANVSNGSDFIYTDKPIKVNFKLEIPLKINSNHLLLEDTLSIDLDSKVDYGIDNAKLKLVLLNYFDCEIKVRLFALNEDKTKGIEFTKNEMIEPYSKNNQIQIINADLSETGKELILKTKKVIAQVELNTSDGFINISADSRLEMKLSIDFKKSNQAF